MRHLLSARRINLFVALALVLTLGASLSLPRQAAAAADVSVYADALAASWDDWSWDSTIDFSSTAHVQSGTHAVAVTFSAADAGFSLRTSAPINTAGYSAISFWVYGGAGGTQLMVYTQVTDDGAASTQVAQSAPAGAWTKISVPLSALGNPATVARINLQSNSGAVQPTFYVDNLSLVATSGAGNTFPDTTPDRTITFPKSMAGVAIAPSGRIYVSSWRESKIYSWPSAAAADNPYTSADIVLGTAMDPENPANGAGCGAQTSTSFCGPEGITVDQSGNLYVAATYENRVQVFLNPETDATPTVADKTITGLNEPRGMTVDANGHLYVADEVNNRVAIYNTPAAGAAAPSSTIGGPGNGDNQFSQPMDVAVDSNGKLYVADLFNHRVMRFDTPLAGDPHAVIYNGFDLPHNIALDAAGNLYVSDVKTNDESHSRIVVIATPLTNSAISYTFPDVDFPLDMAFDGAGNLYAALCVGSYPCPGGGKLLRFDAPAEQPPPPPPPAGDVALGVDASADQHAISPYIYGVHGEGSDATTAPALAQTLHLPLQRWGGNITTRYNWKNDYANHGNDFYFENIAEDNPAPQAGNAADYFVQQGKNAGTDSIITIPLIGKTSRSGLRPDGGHYCSFSTTKYNYTPGPLYDGDPGHDTDDPASSDCGTGVRTNGTPVTGNDPADTSIDVDASYMQAWVQHLVATHGSAANGGVPFYGLDNEPGIWHDTHRDIHPKYLTYDEIRDLTYQYAAAIKTADSGAQTLGPVQDGWTRYFYAGYGDDDAANNAAMLDRTNHGGQPFVEWYLDQMRAYEQQHGTRLLDYFDLHYYPEPGAGIDLSPAGNAATQALRLDSTRSLWDPTFVDHSYIGTDGVEGGPEVRLIPRMHDWVNAHYPGTKLAITEYNWGGLESINGALAQADVLGIFGREGLDLAVLFEPPSPDQPGAYAFRMYRDYDGAGGQFGETGVRATSADQGKLAVYAARRGSDGALTLMVINKTGADLTSGINLAGFSPTGTATVYRYSAANLGAVVRQPDQALNAAGFSATLPANSITLFVLPSATPLPAGDAVITPANGGTLTSTDGRLSIQFPSGSVTEPVGVTYATLPAPTHVLPNGQIAIDSFTLDARTAGGAAVTQFARPFTLQLTYSDAEVAALGVDESSLNLLYWNGNAWVALLPCAGCGIDTANNRITVVANHFSEWALVGTVGTGGGQHKVYLPVVRK